MIKDDNNPQLKLAYNFLQYTNQNLFLTGKAGTGKTTFLKRLKKTSPKRMVVVAPTGVAAINAGGVTIHSFFQLPLGPQIPQTIAGNNSFDNPSDTAKSDQRFNFRKNKINLIRSLDLLVIDEISMVRADILDAIDTVLRKYKNRYLPFGGIQLLMIGDLQQLAPVVKEEEWAILNKYYDTCYFFSSKALKNAKFTGIELQHIYRQNEHVFIDLLNKVRNNEMTADDYTKLNSRYRSGINSYGIDGYITLTTHNHQAKQINEFHLKKLRSPSRNFNCKIEGDFPTIAFPADEVLVLKTEAQVMFLKNDPSPEKRYYNGKIGKVVNLTEDEIEILCSDDPETIKVSQACWENTKYRLKETTGEIEEEVAGRFYQYPLKLAWAITIHKSQGLTFEKAVIDAGQSFAHGQVYVALSRCKSLDGLILSTPLTHHSVINDNTVTGFIDEVERNQPGEQELNKHRKDYELHLLNELIDFRPILRKIKYIEKYWLENDSVLMGELKLRLRNAYTGMQQEVDSVTEKFRGQMLRLASGPLYAEENTILQERLKKAADYFLQKMVEIVIPILDNPEYETDNKAIKKKMVELIANLQTETDKKKICLQAVSKGFNIKTYIEARALACIEKQSYKSTDKAAGIKIKNSEFYTRLLAWRANKSRESGMEEPKILLQKVMVEIAEKLPATAFDLKSIKGMGGKKMENFGQDLLALIFSYRKDTGMEIPVNAQEEIQFAGLDSKNISLHLFKQGLKPAEIAKKRKYAVSTIEGHLIQFIGEGLLDVAGLMNEEKYKVILKHLIDKEASESLTDIKLKLGDNYTFSEIRMVMAGLSREKMLNNESPATQK